MKTGLSLQQLANEVQRQQNSKRDLIAPRGQMAMVNSVIDIEGKEVPSVSLGLQDKGQFPIRKLAHQQIASAVEIPGSYYNRMLSEEPELLTRNVNTWLAKEADKKQLIRLMDGDARALLSDRYNRIDNYDVLSFVLPEILDIGGLQVVSSQITETRLYLKIISSRTELEVQKGDAVQGGFVITNSEVGQGNMQVNPFVYRLVCLNGMTVEEFSQKKRHVGRKLEEEDMQLFSDETRQADMRAFFLKIRDTVRATLDITMFQTIVQKFRDSQGIIIHQPEQIVELTATRFQLNDSEKSSVFQNLLTGGQMNLWGLANAVTRASADIEDYDRASQLELIGSRVLNLEPALVSAKAA